MRVDVHVHTGKYSGCAVDTPEAMVEAAIAAKLDGIVLTEHDLFWPNLPLTQLQQLYPQIKLFTGAEMTTLEGEHILALGLESFEGLYPLLPGLDLVEAIHIRGGIAIYAHPWRWNIQPAPGLSEAVDSLEIASTNINAAMRYKIQSLQKHLNLPGIAASDSHSIDTLGMFAIDLFEDVSTETELATAIRSGEFTNYIDQNRADQRREEFYRGWKLEPIEEDETIG